MFFLQKYTWPSALISAVCMALVGINVIQGYANSLLQIGGLCLFLIFLHLRENKFFLITWLFATTWLSVTVWWLYIALHDIGGMPWVIAVIAIFLLCGGLAIYYATSLTIYILLKNSITPFLRPILFAACWTLAELARAQWFTGFPWGAIGYSHVNGILSYAAPWIGVYGIGFLAALLACWLAMVLTQNTIKKNYKIIISGFILLISLPAIRTETQQGKILSVNLLQGNISQLTKFNSGKEIALDWYASQARESKSNITIMPEIAIPYFKEELPDGYWKDLLNIYETGKQIALIGMPTIDINKGYGNSAVGLGFGNDQQYDKYHLVPFGEFTPQSLKWFTSLMVNDLGDFNRGSMTQAPFIWKDQKISVTICYEDLFGEELAARFIQADRIPTLFVNISNIAWFGDSMVINQHLDIARMRSLEFNRPTVRATNTGGTALISAEGVVTKSLPAFTRGNLQGDIKTIDGGITHFAYWAGHWGLMPMWILCLFILGACGLTHFNLVQRSRL